MVIFISPTLTNRIQILDFQNVQKHFNIHLLWFNTDHVPRIARIVGIYIRNNYNNIMCWQVYTTRFYNMILRAYDIFGTRMEKNRWLKLSVNRFFGIDTGIFLVITVDIVLNSVILVKINFSSITGMNFF